MQLWIGIPIGQSTMNMSIENWIGRSPTTLNQTMIPTIACKQTKPKLLKSLKFVGGKLIKWCFSKNVNWALHS
jgi:hypothetical protein